MSPDPNQGASGPAVRVALTARPRTVTVFEGTREELVAGRRAAALQREYARGQADGERTATARAAGALTKAAERLAQSAELQAAEIARDSVRLAVEIARTLLRHEIDAGRYDIERIVRETLQASGVGRGVCVLHLNPADVSRLEGTVFRTGTTLESDPEVPAGDVHVTTQRGLLVRDLEQALGSIAERLEGEVA